MRSQWKRYACLYRCWIQNDVDTLVISAVKDAQRPFVVIEQAKVRHAPHDVIVKVARTALEAGYASVHDVHRVWLMTSLMFSVFASQRVHARPDDSS